MGREEEAPRAWDEGCPLDLDLDLLDLGLDLEEKADLGRDSSVSSRERSKCCFKTLILTSLDMPRKAMTFLST